VLAAAGPPRVPVRWPGGRPPAGVLGSANQNSDDSRYTGIADAANVVLADRLPRAAHH